MSALSLSGQNVLITRPIEQAKRLAKIIDQHGGNAVIFPLIEIVEPTDLSKVDLAIADLDEVDLLVFVSVNAVDGFLKGLARLNKRIGKKTRVATIGLSTQMHCESFGIVVDFSPIERMDSEGLIERLKFEEVNGARVQIFRGQFGRETLRENLESRGAMVRYVESYQRKELAISVHSMRALWQKQKINCIVITSVSILDALIGRVGEANFSIFQNVHAVVLSQRIASQCQKLSFKSISVTDKPSDQGVLTTLSRLSL